MSKRWWRSRVFGWFFFAVSLLILAFTAAILELNSRAVVKLPPDKALQAFREVPNQSDMNRLSIESILTLKESGVHPKEVDLAIQEMADRLAAESERTAFWESLRPNRVRIAHLDGSISAVVIGCVASAIIYRILA